MRNIVLTIVIASLVALLAACSSATPTLEGTGLTIKNTIQAPAFNMPEETAFGKDTTKTLGASTTSYPASETEYVYDIEVSDSSIKLTWLDNPATKAFERVIEDGTFDRYYLTFDKDIIKSATANTSATLVPNITKVTGTEIEFEVGPGKQVGVGFDIVIDLKLK